MVKGIQPSELDDLTEYDMEIYQILMSKFVKLEDTRMQNNIKKAISDLLG